MLQSTRSSADTGNPTFVEGLLAYCRAHGIPRKHLVSTLEDHAILSTIRELAVKYKVNRYVKGLLDRHEWTVQLLNHRNRIDCRESDAVAITHRRTGRRFRIEAMSAKQESFSLANQTISQPHFAVNLRYSKNNLAREKVGNGLCESNEIGMLVCNPATAIIQRNAKQTGLPLIRDETSIEWLKDHYGTSSSETLVGQTDDDWRFCFIHSLARSNGSMPRSRPILVVNDPNWFRGDVLAAKLLGQVASL